MHAVVTHLVSHPEAQAAWIDTEGDFSPALLKEVIILRLLPFETYITVESVLDRVQIVRVLDIQGIAEVVDELEQTYKHKELDDRGIGVIVVDTIYQPLSELMDSETDGFLDQDAWAFENEKPESMVGSLWHIWPHSI